jgi:N-acetylglucosaminyl-diphospho-decaprenol L-rhamnosyltransferase
MTFATVVVTYLSGDHLPACLASLARFGVSPVWVVDNSPRRDPSPPSLYEHHPENLGFAGGVNRGFVLSKEAAGPPEAGLVLILNPDCILRTNLDAMVAEFADPQVGAVGGRLADSQERTQTGFTVRRFPTPGALALEILGVNRLVPANAVNRWYRCVDCDLGQRQAVEQPAGAFLMVRRAAFEAVGGWDEGFHPVWFEDVDFCKRLKSAGWEVRYTPEASAEHAGGHSVGRLDPASKTVAWYGSLLRYSAKHFPPSGRWLVASSLLLAAVPRGVVGSLQEGRMQPFWAHLQVARLAIKRLILGDNGS